MKCLYQTTLSKYEFANNEQVWRYDRKGFLHMIKQDSPLILILPAHFIIHYKQIELSIVYSLLKSHGAPDEYQQVV
jgi:hypothetical protein